MSGSERNAEGVSEGETLSDGVFVTQLVLLIPINS